LQQEKPDDFVIATGETHSVREFVELAFQEIGKTVLWEGSELEERGVDADTGEILVKVDARYFRPAEVEYLIGDATKASDTFGWKPKTSFKELVKIMVQADRDECVGGFSRRR
jgi:GDPmannose 4,6-dehydratase